MGARLYLLTGALFLLAGCQTVQHQSTSLEGADNPKPRVHIFIESGNTDTGDITLVDAAIPLHKAIKYGLPTATILPDAGVDMGQTISVWVESASTTQYLTQIGRTANVSIEHSDGVVTVSPIARWNFTLPRKYADKATALSRSSTGVSVIMLESADDFVTLLVTAPPSEMVQLRTAIYQLSDQATLDETFAELNASGAE